MVGVDLAGSGRAERVEAAGGTFEACDVTDEGAWERLAREIARTQATLNLLVLNAGIMTRSPQAPIDDDVFALAGSAGYRRMFAVNVDGVTLGIKHMRPLLEPGAAITVTASEAGLGGQTLDPYYSMSKHAVVGLVRSVAPLLLASHIRINALCPGGIDTAIVPHALRGVVPSDAFRAPALIAQSLLAMAARPTTGGTWQPTADGDVVEYQVPPHK